MIGRLYFDNEMNNFLYTTSGSRISVALIHCDGGIINEVGNFIRREPNHIDMISYIPNNRYDSENYNSSLFNVDKSRVKIKIGRFINKFITEKSLKDLNISPKEIEDFVNIFKSYFNSKTDSLQIVKGTDIQKWYLEDNYSSVLGNRSGSLWNSCMRQSHRNEFMKLYSDNLDNVKMLISLNDDGKLRSRALLWDNVTDKEGNKYKFMDRVYSIYEHDIYLFKSWAKENGYISKWEQNAKSQKLFDINGNLKELSLYVKLDKFQQEFYPYLDTFKFFNNLNGQFSNCESFNYRYKLVQSNGMPYKEEEPEEEYYEEEWYEEEY